MKKPQHVQKLDKSSGEPTTLPAFTMQALVRQTGIAPDTLRAWERRYGFPEPARSGGGHRLYSPLDVEAIRWVIQKQTEGVRARQAIELWKHQAARLQAPAAALLRDRETTDALRTAWLQACLSLDDHSATQIFNSANAILGPEVALLQVATAGLSEIGERWTAGSASIAQEHFASALAMRHVQSLLSVEAAATRAGKLLVACPAGETHVYPAVVLTYLLRRRGWRVIFLNADLPVRDLRETVEREQPSLVVGCAQTVPTVGALLADGEAMRATHGAFAFGGSVFVRHPSLSARIPGVYLGNQLAEAPGVVERILNGELAPHTPARLARPWRELTETLQDTLRRVEAEVLADSRASEIGRADAEAELALLRGYLLSVAQLGAAEMLPEVWTWSERMLQARGLDAKTRIAFLQNYRRRLHAHWPDAELFGLALAE